MTDWLQQYSAALEVRDVREKAHKPYIDAYTALADRVAQSAATTEHPTQPAPPADQTKLPTRGRPGKEPEPPTSDLLSTLRTDLASTQKARASLQAQLEDLTAQLTALTTQQRASQAQIFSLTKQKTELERKVRDRDEEVRGKSKMVEQAHDEMVAQGLQLNLAEDRSAKLEEAERVNRDSRWE